MNKRLKQVTDCCTQYYISCHNAFIQSTSINSKQSVNTTEEKGGKARKKRKIKKKEGCDWDYQKGWHPDFVLQLPAPTTLPLLPTRKKPESLPVRDEHYITPDKDSCDNSMKVYLCCCLYLFKIFTCIGWDKGERWKCGITAGTSAKSTIL